MNISTRNINVSGCGNTGQVNNITVIEPREEKLPSSLGLPIRNLYFAGRKKYLQYIDTELGTHGFATLYGLDGIGKTAIALEYVWLYFESFRGIKAWFEASSYHQLVSAYASFGESLDLNLQNITLEEVKAGKVKSWFERSEEEWLIVYNNVDSFKDIEKLVPSRGGKVIFTSRLQAGWPGAGINVTPLSEIDSLEMVLKILEVSPVEDANFLGSTLGYLPLA